MVTQGKERSLPVYDPTCSSGYLLLWAKCEGKDVDIFTVKYKVKLFEWDCGFSYLLVETRLLMEQFYVGFEKQTTM